MENMENYLKKIENKYILQEIISQTKHSKIYFGYSIDKPKKSIVIKLFNGNISIDEELFNQNLKKILNFNNSNIIKILDGGKGEINSINSNNTKNLYYLIEDYQNKGELFDYISLYQKGFGEKISKLLFFQILSALNYYSLQGLFFDCIKFDNILLDNDYKIKITDFLIENVKTKFSSQFDNCDLATLLFSLVTGRDPKIIGKNINKKKLDKFWLSSKFIVINEKLSKEFIDLFNKIILNNFDISSDLNLENDDFYEFNYYEKIMNHPWFEGIKIENILSNYNNCYDIVTKEFNLRYSKICKKNNTNEEIINLNKFIINNNYNFLNKKLESNDMKIFNNNLNGMMNLQNPNTNFMNNNSYEVNRSYLISNNTLCYNNNNYNNIYNNNNNILNNQSNNIYNNNNNILNNQSNNIFDNNDDINECNDINIENGYDFNANGYFERPFDKYKKNVKKSLSLKNNYYNKEGKKKKKIEYNAKIDYMNSNLNEDIKKNNNTQKSFKGKVINFNKSYTFSDSYKKNKNRKFNKNAKCVKFKKFKNNSIKIIQLYNIKSPYDFMNKVLNYCEKISNVTINYNKFKIYCSKFENGKELIVKISLMKNKLLIYDLVIQKIVGNNFIYSFFESQISKKINTFYSFY